jgi:ACS family tartrate transporter-like MFS transporter
MSRGRWKMPLSENCQRARAILQRGQQRMSWEENTRDRVLRKVRRRIVPFAFICYVVAYIDRVNVSFAASALQRDLGLSSTQFGVGAGLFFLGYCLFEIPSNLIMERVGARRWIARIMIGWGLVSMATCVITGPRSFMISRVLLGIAEAGFFPGMILYLTYWIPAADRARTGALFMMAAPVAVIVGAPVSEALLKLDGVLGLHGWQWLFLVEGLPAVALGGLSLLVLTDRPESAHWLPPDDRRVLAETMASDRARREAVGHTSVKATFASGSLWLLCGVFFMNTVVTYGIFLWLPKLLQDVSGATGFTLSTITSVPFVAALIAMPIVGRHSDRTGERRWHVAACAVTSAAGLLLAVAAQHNMALLVLSFTLSQMAQRSLVGVFWALPPQFLGGAAAAAGIALINAIGNLGGFVGPALIGMLHDLTGSYTGGMLMLAGALIVEALLVVALKLPREPGAVMQAPPLLQKDHDPQPSAVRLGRSTPPSGASAGGPAHDGVRGWRSAVHLARIARDRAPHLRRRQGPELDHRPAGSVRVGN